VNAAANFFERQNPNAPRMTAQQRAAMGQEMQEHLDELGIDRGKQRDIARSIANPNQFRTAQNLVRAMQAQGVDEKTALEQLPEIFNRTNGRGVNVARETNIQVNKLVRMGNAMVNEWDRVSLQTMRNNLELELMFDRFNNRRNAAQNLGR